MIRYIITILLGFICISSFGSDPDMPKTYEQLRYQMIHYNVQKIPNQHTYTKSDLIMTGVSTTCIAGVNVMVFAQGPLAHRVGRSDKVYKNQLKMGVLVLDVFFIAIQTIYYTRRN
jgi:hypothetical protein